MERYLVGGSVGEGGATRAGGEGGESSTGVVCVGGGDLCLQAIQKWEKRVLEEVRRSS